MYYDGAYSPFGEAMAEAGIGDRNSTGKNHDVRPDLYDFMYRDYRPSQLQCRAGRFAVGDAGGQRAAVRHQLLR
jgi:hypothetical protein